MTRSLLLVFFLLAAPLLTSAQDSTPMPTPKSAAIAGTVVAEPGSKPLKKVLVQVVAEDQKQGGNYSASTDADGHFRVDNVLPGRYRIFIERTGFVGVNDRGLKSETNVLSIQPGQSIDDLVFRMLLTAVITGRVTDEDGDPMSGVRVVAQKKTPGKSTRESIGATTTNDLGEYRIAGLFPGPYWIAAMPPPDFRDYEKQPKAPQGDNQEQADSRYVTTFYPGSYDAAQASPVTLKAGDEIPVNFTLVPAQAYRVRGIVTGVQAGQKASVELMSKAGDSMHANDVGPDGRFEVRGVAPGSYVAWATVGNDQQALKAHQDVSVVAGDVDGVKLIPEPSFTLTGRVRLETRAPADLSQYSVNLRPAELPDDNDPGFIQFMPMDSFGTNAPVDRFGNVEWKNVRPGNYIVQVYGGDGKTSFFLKSATLGAQAIDTGFTASGPATIDLLVSTYGGTLQGTVVEKEKDVDNVYPIANATVVAVPEEKYRKILGRCLTGSTDQRGRFTIHGLPPGSYTLYAWLDIEDGVWYDADFLKSQAPNGIAVRVEENSDQKVDLKLSPVAAEWR